MSTSVPWNFDVMKSARIGMGIASKKNQEKTNQKRRLEYFLSKLSYRRPANICVL